MSGSNPPIPKRGCQIENDSPDSQEVMWGYTFFTKREEINYNINQEGDDLSEEYER